jgi:cystathionine beta-lyase
MACRAAYERGGGWLEALKGYLASNLALLRGFLDESLPGVRLVEPEGTYLAWLDFRGSGVRPEDLDRFIVDKARLWLDGGAMFGPEGLGFQRVNIACPKSVLEQALGRLLKAFRG